MTRSLFAHIPPRGGRGRARPSGSDERCLGLLGAKAAASFGQYLAEFAKADESMLPQESTDPRTLQLFPCKRGFLGTTMGAKMAIGAPLAGTPSAASPAVVVGEGYAPVWEYLGRRAQNRHFVPRRARAALPRPALGRRRELPQDPLYRGRMRSGICNYLARTETAYPTNPHYSMGSVARTDYLVVKTAARIVLKGEGTFFGGRWTERLSFLSQEV
jgi:hypothetical protein